MLGTFTRVFKSDFVFHSLCFISLFNFLPWSFHGVQAAPVLGRWDCCASSRANESSTAFGQLHAVTERFDLYNATSVPTNFDATSPMVSVSTGVAPTASYWALLASALSTSWNLSSSVSSTSSSYIISPVVTSSLPSAHAGGSRLVENNTLSSSPAPTGASLMVPLASPGTPAVSTSWVATFSENSSSSATTTTILFASGTIVIPPPVSQGNPTVTVVSPFTSLAVQVATTTGCMASPPTVTPPAVGYPTVSLSSPETSPVIPSSSLSGVLVPPVVLPSTGGLVTVTPSVGGPTTTETSAPSTLVPDIQTSFTQAMSSLSVSANVQSGSQLEPQATSSPSPVQNAASSELSGSLVTIIAAFSLLGLVSISTAIVVFMHTRRSRVAQKQRFADVTIRPSPQNLSSRFSVSTVGSTPALPLRLLTLMNHVSRM